MLNSPETERKMLSEAPTPTRVSRLGVSKDLEMHMFFETWSVTGVSHPQVRYFYLGFEGKGICPRS